jgi:hypothetical protein
METILRHTSRFGFYCMVAWSATQVLALLTNQIPLIALHESIGNGDAFVLGGVEGLRTTGVLYPAWGQEHLVPPLYSPFLYWMHAVAWSVVPTENPYIGPRLLELVWFLAALASAALVAQRLIPARGTFRLALLSAVSFSVMTSWVMQLRSDFPGITCSMLALYFLMSRRPRDVWWAGLLAGLALQFKITFVAAAAAGCLWLLLYRRWQDFVRFAAAAAVSSVGLYFLINQFEPEMLNSILMMRKMIAHPAGVVRFIREVFNEPSFLLALAIFATMLARPFGRWRLLALFLGCSFVVATYTSLQAGASINYFYEPLLASTPFVTLGMLRLRSARLGSAGTFLGLLVLLPYALPLLARTLREAINVPARVEQRNADYDSLRTALKGKTLLSTMPDVTAAVPDRVVPDSILLNYLVLTAGADISPLEAKVRQGDFDLVVTHPGDYLWRRVPELPRGLRRAIMDSYHPYCLLRNMLVHLPNNPARSNEELAQRIKNLGCQPCRNGNCPGLDIAVEAF